MMEKSLTSQIVRHIFINFGIAGTMHTSILSDAFLTNHTIEYEDEENIVQKSNVWIAEANNNNVKISVACTEFIDTEEIIMVIGVENCPTYGCWLNWEKYTDVVRDGMISFAMKENKWIEADAFVQFTFAAGLEQFKDLMISFGAAKNSNKIYESLISFIKHCDEI